MRQLDEIDARSDIYSLGAILYELLTFQRPVEGLNALAILGKVINEDVTPPDQRTPQRHIPRELSAVVMKCLRKARQDRYQSVGELSRDVKSFLEGRSVSAQPDTFAQALVKLVKRNKGISTSIGIAAAILIAVVSFAFVRVTLAMERAVRGEQQAVAARQKERETAMASSEALARQAVQAADEGRFAEAEVRADAALVAMPQSPWGHYASGVVAFEKKDLPASRSHLEEAIRVDPSHAQSRTFLAKVLVAAGQLVEWEAVLAQADQATDWHSLVAAGDAFFSALRYKDAAKAYRRADALADKDTTASATVRGKVKDNLENAEACIKMEGFWESIRNLSPQEQQLRINAKLMEVFGGGTCTLKDGAALGIDLGDTKLRWLDPLRGLPLTSLLIYRTQVADLTPLKGMPLKGLNLNYTRVVDLRPVEGMPLEALICVNTPVHDLSPLKGMNLKVMHLRDCLVTDLTPLQGMRLETLNFTPRTITKGMVIVRDMKSLREIGTTTGEDLATPSEFWRRYDAGEFK